MQTDLFSFSQGVHLIMEDNNGGGGKRGNSNSCDGQFGITCGLKPTPS